MSEINLNHAVRQAISASNAKYDDEDVIDRVRARKNKSAAGGWTGGRAGVGRQQRGSGNGEGQGLWGEDGRVSSGLRARTGSWLGGQQAAQGRADAAVSSSTARFPACLAIARLLSVLFETGV